MQLATVGPASDSARSQLLFALLILSLAVPALISIPTPTSGLTFDFGLIPEELTPGMTAEHSGWVRPYIRGWNSNAYIVRADYFEAPVPSAPRQRLDLLPSGRLLLDSRPIELERLRAEFDLLMTTTGWIDFHPDPNARYGDVVETLAPVARSAFGRLRLDNSRYARAFDAAAGGAEPPPRPASRRSGRKSSRPGS